MCFIKDIIKIKDMKKLFMIVAAATVIGTATAQDGAGKAPVTRPVKGSISTEIQFNPFDQNGHTFSIDGIKARFFISDRDALRAKIGFGLSTDKFRTGADDSSYDKTRTGDVSIGVGYERHFPVAKRLDFYVGGQFEFAKHFARTDGESAGLDYVVEGAAIDVSDISNPFAGLNESNRASSSFSVAAFGGLDVYVYRGLYLGTELGFDINASRFDKVRFKPEGLPKRETTDTARKLNIGFYIEPTIRLGYTF